MPEPGFFKTATFGGFDKKSVLYYIDTLNENFQNTEKEYQEKLEGFGKAQESQLAHIRSLEAQLAEQNAKLETVAAHLEQEREVARQAQEQISQLEAQNRTIEKQLSDGAREIEIQLERNRQLQFRAESLDYKSKKYDEISNQIGDTIIEARQNADHIVAAAHTQAQEIAMAAQQRMNSFYSELGSFKGDASRLRKSIEEILFVLNDRIDVMQEVVGQVEKRFSPEELSLIYTQEEPQPFETPADQAGYLGGNTDANMEH